ncbi:MAG: glycosyltransferase family 39 protein [Parachlamydiaceae bacterium]|nr:glycosyltransferase family 39 protein [Parachlamydiaceae bacterium]
MKSRYFLILCLLLIVKLGAMVFVIQKAGIGLGPDEAQYWTWSQQLDWGYYSKPPGIAWQIWLGTELFGNTELGVRFGSLILGVLLSLATYWLAIACRTTTKTAFWAALVMAFTPVGLLGSIFAITDGGLVLFWTLGCVVIAYGLSQNRTPNYYLLGLMIACGALFKWPIYLLWGILVIFMYWFSVLRSPHIVGGALLSLLGLFPSVMWNAKHEWATFRHVTATVAGGHGESAWSGNVLEFIGSQAGLVSPIIFVLLILAFIFLLRHHSRIPASLTFSGGSCLIIVTAYIIMSLFQKAQGNWCAFAYPPGFVFLSWYSLEATRYKKLWLKGGLILSVLLCGLILSIPTIQADTKWNDYSIPYKLNPFRHNLGWNQLSIVLNKVGYDPQTDFLFGDKYQTSSILSFYGPSQKRAYFLNLNHIRKNQFSFWPSMAQEQIGKTGYFVITENSPHLERNMGTSIALYQEILQKYFERVDFLGVSSLFDSYGMMAKGALIFRCVNYNGLEPDASALY